LVERQIPGAAWQFANEARLNRDVAITSLMANGVGKQDAMSLIDEALAFKKSGGTWHEFAKRYYYACMEQAGLIPYDPHVVP